MGFLFLNQISFAVIKEFLVKALFFAKTHLWDFCRYICKMLNKIQSGFDGFHWITFATNIFWEKGSIGSHEICAPLFKESKLSA